MIWVYEFAEDWRVRKFLKDFVLKEPILPIWRLQYMNVRVSPKEYMIIISDTKLTGIIWISLALAALGFVFQTVIPLVISMGFVLMYALISSGMLFEFLANRTFKKKGLPLIKTVGKGKVVRAMVHGTERNL